MKNISAISNDNICQLWCYISPIPSCVITLWLKFMLTEKLCNATYVIITTWLIIFLFKRWVGLLSVINCRKKPCYLNNFQFKGTSMQCDIWKIEWRNMYLKNSGWQYCLLKFIASVLLCYFLIFEKIVNFFILSCIYFKRVTRSNQAGWDFFNILRSHYTFQDATGRATGIFVHYNVVICESYRSSNCHGNEGVFVCFFESAWASLA